ncbi:MAG: proline dehydrogenase family protein [Propionibacteriales bacterium]|nr:proline dehydrogenase family protein [Propionibacteriales bacterium]
MLRRSLLMLSHSDTVKHAVSSMPVSSGIVARFVAGESVDHAVEATGQLVSEGLLVSLDHLGEDTRDVHQAQATVEAYLLLLERLAAAGLTRGAEVSVKLSAVGQALPGDGERIALEHARKIAQAASNAGTTVTLDMEDHTTIDSTLSILRELRQDFPSAGAVLQSYLRRCEADCRDLACAGSRVRLCKGAYTAPESVAYQDKSEVDLSYVRCLKALMAGQGYPMVATHDPRLIKIAGSLATRNDRAPGSYEYQLLFGVRPEEQKRLAAAGERVRIYVPYGDEWYGYLMRRLAERPANVAFFARSVLTKS